MCKHYSFLSYTIKCLCKVALKSTKYKMNYSKTWNWEQQKKNEREDGAQWIPIKRHEKVWKSVH